MYTEVMLLIGDLAQASDFKEITPELMLLHCEQHHCMECAIMVTAAND
jgi:hypothetical protein